MQISGIIGPDTNPILNQYDALHIYGVSGTWNYIKQTGNANLVAAITSLSGYAGNTYATITNLTSTGVTIEAQIVSVSGWAGNASGALQTLLNTTNTNLATTGTTLVNLIAGLSGVHNSGLGSLSGWASGLSGVLQTNINTVATNLTSTGITLLTDLTNASGQFNINYAPSLANYVYTTGYRAPALYFGLSNITLTSGYYVIIATGNPASVTGILPNPLAYSGNFFDLINNTTGPLQLSGIIGPDTNPILYQYDTLSIYATSGVWNYIKQTGNLNLVNAITSLSGYVGNTFSTLTNLTLTGQTLYNLIVGLSGAHNSGIGALSGWVSGASGVLQTNINTVATNLTSTGITLINLIGGLSGVHNSGLGALSGWASGLSGILQGEIGNVSVPPNILFTTGNQVKTGNFAVTGFVNIGGTIAPNYLYNILSITSGGSGFVNISLQNPTAASGASADYIINSNSGNNLLYYIDIGINNSIYSQTGINVPIFGTGYDGYVFVQGNSGALMPGQGNLYLGTVSTGTKVFLFAGNFSGLPSATIDSTGINIPAGFTYRIGNQIIQNLFDPTGIAASSGQVLYNLIVGLSGVYNSGLGALSGWSSGLSGYGASTYATILNLTTTGVNIELQINSLSGFTTGISGFFRSGLGSLSGFASGISGYDAATYATITNLTTTGVNIELQINSLSGFTTGISGVFNTKITSLVTGLANPNIYNSTISCYQTSFVPLSSGWYRIMSGSSQYAGGSMRIYSNQINPQNAYLDEEILFSIAGYNISNSFMEWIRHSAYNQSVITQARMGSDGGPNVMFDVLVNSGQTGLAAINIAFYGQDATPLLTNPISGIAIPLFTPTQITASAAGTSRIDVAGGTNYFYQNGGIAWFNSNANTNSLQQFSAASISSPSDGKIIVTATGGLGITGAISTSQQGVTNQNLTPGTINIVGTGNVGTINWAASNNFYWAITGNSTVQLANARDGQTVLLSIYNTGAWTVSWSGIRWAPTGLLPIQTTSGHIDAYTINCNQQIFGGVSGYLGSYVQNF